VPPISTPPRFDLDVAVRGHGWYDLPPFSYDRATRTLRLVPLIEGKAIAVRVCQSTPGATLHLLAMGGRIVQRRAEQVVALCLRLDEDLAPLHRAVAGDPALEWAARRGAGRLLRAPTVWEDLVKLLCTTNCTWSLTRVMVRNLVDELGERAGGDADAARSFPTPQAVAHAGLDFLRNKVRAGYRAPFLLELAARVAAGQLDLERLRDPVVGEDEVNRTLRQVKGAGPYVVDNMQRLLGRYDALGLDSWCRARYRELYPRTRGGLEVAIRRRYGRYRPYTGLALWLDLTRGWHEGSEKVWP
jgi:N-glycosylase/DNA lyase